MTTIPKALQYQTIKPKGVKSTFKRWPIQPQTTFKNFAQNEIIRFEFQTNDFIDPYQSYLEVDIEFDPTDYENLTNFDPFGTSGNAAKYNRRDAIPTFHLDGPSTSLVSEFAFYQEGKLLEQIFEYDQIGYILSDLNMNIGCRLFKAFEGYHYERMPDQKYNNQINSRRVVQQGNPSQIILNDANQTPASPSFGQHMQFQSNPLLAGQIYSSLQAAMHYGAYIQSGYLNFASNSFKYKPLAGDPTEVQFATNEEILNYNGGTLSRAILNNTVETTGSLFYKHRNTGIFDNYALPDRLPKFNYALQNVQNDASTGVSAEGALYGGLYGQIVIPKGTGYTFTTENLIPQFNKSNAASAIRSNLQNGYARPLSAGSSYNKTLFISPFIPHVNIVNGQFQQTGWVHGWNTHQFAQDEKGFMTTKRKFYVPILSGIIGQLIPRDEWKLLPGSGLGKMLFEWKMNQYAFFASGVNFSKLDQADSTTIAGMSSLQYQFPMKWKITKIQMQFDLWSFDEVIHQQVNNQLRTTGIHLTSQGFLQGPRYQIANTPGIRNNWHINSGVRSARGIYFWFLDDRYQKYSTCRKQYRLSHNLKYMQLKAGQKYIPQQPIKGNAGCISLNNLIPEDLTEFYVELQRCTGTMFDCEKPLNITPEQFCVNERPYDPDDLSHVYAQAALFHEERCRGQAIYGFDLMSDPNDLTVLSGMDLNEVKPIELILDYNQGGDFQLSSTMYIFIHYDMLVQFSNSGIMVAGKG